MKHGLKLLAMSVFITGCTTAGPFVSSISNDGNGKIVVEKCMVKLNAFLGVVHNTECSNYKINLYPPQHSQQTNQSNQAEAQHGNMWQE